MMRVDTEAIDVLKGYCDGNLANILPVIEAHPETQFVIYYPPYSILYWQEQIVQERLDQIMEINRYIFDCIQDGERQITLENMEDYLKNMYRIAAEYPYEKLWE